MSLLRQLWLDNWWWLSAVIATTSVVLGFAIGGKGWGVAGIIFFLLLALVATANSLIRTRRALERPATDPEQLAGEHETPDDPNGDGPRLKEETAERGEEDSQSESEPTEDEIEDSAFLRALAAAENRERRAVAEIMDAEIDQAESSDARIRNTSLKYLLLQRAGDQGAIEELRAVADENPRHSSPLTALVNLLVSLGEPETAIQEIDARLPQLADADSDELLELRIRKAELYRNIGDFQSALQTLPVSVVDDAQSERVRASVWEERGRNFEELGNTIVAFGCFERSLTVNPSNEALRFHLAYLYGENDYSELAVFHYNVLVGSNTDRVNAYNNMAVEISGMGLQFEAHDLYRRAASNGSSLATANLAYLAIEAGDAERAEQWISEGREMEHVHENLPAAERRLRDEQRQDKEGRQQVLEGAKRLRRFALAAIDGSHPEDLAGTWDFGDFGDVELVAEDGDWSASWEDDSYRWTVDLSDKDVSSPLVSVKIKRDRKSLITFDQKTWKGQLVYVSDGQLIGWMRRTDEKERSLVEFHRI